MVRQRTLKNSIHCSGIGLHLGDKISMTLHPAEADSGIRFLRTDIEGTAACVPADWRHAIETPLCTTLMNPQGVRIATIEHLMAALAGCGVDNCLIELNGSEVPIMDGSAAPFVFLIECAGVVEQPAPRRSLRILERIEVVEPGRSVALVPDSDFTVAYDIDFPSPAVAQQSWRGSINEHAFKRDLSRARTFGFLEDVTRLRERGLARGGSLDNAVVISGTTILNTGGLRYEDEFVRHKVLDGVGDLYLTGGPIEGRFEAHCAGHAITLRLLHKLFAETAAWEWVESPAPERRGSRPSAEVMPLRAVARA